MIRVLILCLGVVPLGGCSLLFVRGPKPVSNWAEAPEPPVCTENNAAPVLDTLFAVLQGVRAVAGAAVDDSFYRDFPLSREADILTGVGLGALFAVSAAVGFGRTSECKAAISEQASGAEDRARNQREREWGSPFSTPRRQPNLIAPPPVPLGDECDHDAVCPAPKVCERGRCQPYLGQP